MRTFDYSICIPWRENPERKEIFDWVIARWQALFPNVPIILGDSEGEFNRSAARNNAVKQAMTEAVILADADVIPMKKFIVDALEIVYMSKRPTLAYADLKYYNLSQEYTEQILSMKPNALISEPTDSEMWEFCVTSWAGMIVCPVDTYWKLGGHDENFKGWGSEDYAFRDVVNAFYGGFERVNGFLAHLWHPYTQQSTWENPSFNANRARQMQYHNASDSAVAMHHLLEQMHTIS